MTNGNVICVWCETVQERPSNQSSDRNEWADCEHCEHDASHLVTENQLEGIVATIRTATGKRKKKFICGFCPNSYEAEAYQECPRCGRRESNQHTKDDLLQMLAALEKADV